MKSHFFSKTVWGEIQLLTADVFFGASFAGQRLAMTASAESQDTTSSSSQADRLGPLTYNAWRYLISVIALVITRPILQRLIDSEFDEVEEAMINESNIIDRSTWITGTTRPTNTLEIERGDYNRYQNSIETISSSTETANSLTKAHCSRIDYEDNRDTITSEFRDIHEESYQLSDNEIIGKTPDESEYIFPPIYDRMAELWYWGLICGISNFAGSVLQQIALVSVSAGKSGFITGMYVVLVPIIEWFMPSKSHHVSIKSAVAAVSSLIGMYFLSGCMGSNDCLDSEAGQGEILLLISVFAWAVSILASDSASKRVDCVSLTCIEFAISGLLNFLAAYLFESKDWSFPPNYPNVVWLSIFIVGITEAAAFLFSMLGQMYVTATRASLLMSLETVCSAISGYIVLNEKLNSFELFGCLIMFLSTIVSSVDNIQYLWTFKEAEEEERELLVRRLSMNRLRTRSDSMTVTGTAFHYKAIDGANVEMKKIFTQKRPSL